MRALSFHVRGSKAATSFSSEPGPLTNTLVRSLHRHATTAVNAFFEGCKPQGFRAAFGAISFDQRGGSPRRGTRALPDIYLFVILYPFV